MENGDLKLLEVLHRLRSRQRVRVSSARYARCCAVEPSEEYFVVDFGLKVLRTQWMVVSAQRHTFEFRISTRC